MDQKNEFTTEQKFLDHLYTRLDSLKATSQKRKDLALKEISDNPQELSERDSYEKFYNDELTKLNKAENNLYFGKITTPQETIRIGKISVLDDDEEITTLLTDWRAPIARLFYLATPANPENVLTKSHINTRNRKITDIKTMHFDSLESAESQNNIVDENYLIAALNKAKTNKMQDIVHTIQIEQDNIIRSNYKGITIVQGGPGTGKTAVALHRVAYLLYTYRQQLSRSGVLIIGPNNKFIDYIDQVLPDLGETGVILKTIGEFYPGIKTHRPETEVNLLLKGDLQMLTFLKKALNLQITPKISHYSPIVVEGIPLNFNEKIVRQLQKRTNQINKPYLENRKLFIKSLAKHLLTQYKQHIELEIPPEDIPEILQDITSNEEFQKQVNLYWPNFTPITLLKKIYADQKLLQQLSKQLHTNYHTLFRPVTAEFTIADVPLLDELADLLGTSDLQQKSQKQSQHYKQLIKEAQNTLDLLAGSAPQDLEDELDPEILMAYDLIDAETLAARQNVSSYSTVVEKAAGDRNWAYGHVVVDEAQELTPMDWHMVFKQIPSKWMTVVGDVNQISNPLGSTAWKETFYPYVKDRLNYQELTINYRTPQEIMDSITPIVTQLNYQSSFPKAIRSNNKPPIQIAIKPDYKDLKEIVEKLVKKIPRERSIAIICAQQSDYALINQLLPELSNYIFPLVEAKGLEFDVVLLLEPNNFLINSAHGLQNLLVASTRATQQLILLTSANIDSLFLNTRITAVENYTFA